MAAAGEDLPFLPWGLSAPVHLSDPPRNTTPSLSYSHHTGSGKDGNSFTFYTGNYGSESRLRAAASLIPRPRGGRKWFRRRGTQSQATWGEGNSFSGHTGGGKLIPRPHGGRETHSQATWGEGNSFPGHMRGRETRSQVTLEDGNFSNPLRGLRIRLCSSCRLGSVSLVPRPEMARAWEQG